jgi:hypothetical protein
MVLDPDAVQKELAEAEFEVNEAEAEFVAMCDFYGTNAAIQHFYGDADPCPF